MIRSLTQRVLSTATRGSRMAPLGRRPASNQPPQPLPTRESLSRLDAMNRQLALFKQLPSTPVQFSKEDLLLGNAYYGGLTPGHGACSGCGEVTALHNVTAINHSQKQALYTQHIADLKEVLTQIAAKLKDETLSPETRTRLEKNIPIIKRRLWHFESGPTASGRSRAVIVNATGCSSVYASTFPFNSYVDPWTNSLFQDHPAVASGFFQNLARQHALEFRAIREAKADIANTPLEDLTYLGYEQFTPEEMRLLPTVFAVGGDGSFYDIGFGAMSKVLSTKENVMMVVLDTGAYSNTGGQISTAGFTGQDADLSRHGKIQKGKTETRKELGIIAMHHPHVFAIQTTAGMRDHFQKATHQALSHTSGPRIAVYYAPCQPEHGIPDNASQRQAENAVKSRMFSVFIHDPDAGKTMAERLSLEGNPDLDKDWTTGYLPYRNEDGNMQIKEIEYTPADFAITEGRFRKQFSPASVLDDTLIPLTEFIKLDPEEREGRTPFIWSTDKNQHLKPFVVSQPMVELTEQRLAIWHYLQEAAGLKREQLIKSHFQALEQRDQRIQSLQLAMDTQIDDIVAGMVELTSVSGMAQTPTVGGASATQTELNVTIENEENCSSCASKCFEKAPTIFGRKTIVGPDGDPKEVAVVKNAHPDPDQRETLLKIEKDCTEGLIEVS